MQLDATISLNERIALETMMSRQTKDHSLIYYEIGIDIFNCRLSHMKHNRPIPSIM